MCGCFEFRYLTVQPYVSSNPPNRMAEIINRPPGVMPQPLDASNAQGTEQVIVCCVKVTNSGFVPVRLRGPRDPTPPLSLLSH